MIPTYGRRHRPVLAPPAVHPFRVGSVSARLLPVLGVREGHCVIRIDDAQVEVCYGRWRARTSLTNIVSVHITDSARTPSLRRGAHAHRAAVRDDHDPVGPGPGVRIGFREPIRLRRLPRHTLTVIVADPHRLVRDLRGRIPNTGPPQMSCARCESPTPRPVPHRHG